MTDLSRTDSSAAVERILSLEAKIRVAIRQRNNLRASLKSIAQIEHYRKPTTTWRDLTIEAIGIAKAALLEDKK